MHSSYLIKQLKTEFQSLPFFTRNDLFNYFNKFEGDVNLQTTNWRIHNFKSKGIIQEIKKGVYSFDIKPIYKPEINNKLYPIRKILNEYSSLKYCLIDTIWLNQFSLHQLTKSIVIIEIEKDMINFVFDKFKEKGFNVFLNPSLDIIENYISGGENKIILKSYLVNSPTQISDNLIVPKIEKIIVDIFSEKKTYFMLSKNELKFIFNKIFYTYRVQLTILRKYAIYRNKYSELKKFLNDNLENMEIIKLL